MNTRDIMVTKGSKVAGMHVLPKDPAVDARDVRRPARTGMISVAGIRDPRCGPFVVHPGDALGRAGGSGMFVGRMRQPLDKGVQVLIAVPGSTYGSQRESEDVPTSMSARAERSSAFRFNSRSSNECRSVTAAMQQAPCAGSSPVHAIEQEERSITDRSIGDALRWLEHTRIEQIRSRPYKLDETPYHNGCS